MSTLIIEVTGNPDRIDITGNPDEVVDDAPYPYPSTEQPSKRQNRADRRTGFTSGWEIIFVLDRLVDIVLFVHIMVFGLEIDYEEQIGKGVLNVVRELLLSIYIVELSIKLCMACLRPVALSYYMDLILVILACTEVFSGGAPGYFWRLTILRIHRYSRLIVTIKHKQKDLWVVCSGITASLKPLTWFGLILGAIVACGACLARGLVRRGPDYMDWEGYFGSVPLSALTMFQLATLEGWAGSIIRPLVETNPVAAVSLVCFMTGTAYGVANVMLGLLVWSTIEVARTHENHAMHAGVAQDRQLILDIVAYFEATLVIDDKEKLELTDLKEAMSMTRVRGAFQDLELPFKTLDLLWTHMSGVMRCGDEMTIEQFKKGLLLLKEPASKYDIALLSAKLAGGVLYTQRLDKRADKLLGGITRLSGTIQGNLQTVADNLIARAGTTPEFILRQEKKIKPGPPRKKARYTDVRTLRAGVGILR